MKNRTILSIALVCIMISLSFTNDAFAQRKKKSVKRHVKTHHKKHFRPVKGRRVAHYRYRHLPRRGKVVRSVGVGFAGIKYKGVHFRFHNGVWYKPRDKRFIVVHAPLGVRLRTLPVGYTRMVVGPKPYFYYYGTFYVKTGNPEGEYEVVSAPAGAEIDALPDGYEIVKAKGKEYYTLDKIYYEPMIDENDNEYYVVAVDPTK